MKYQTAILSGVFLISLSLQAGDAKSVKPIAVPENIRTSVAKADTDKSGDLSVAEFGKMIRKNTLRHLEKENLEGDALEAKATEVEAAKFKGVDTDKSGGVSAEEYAVSRAAAAERKAKKKKAASQ